MLMPGETANFEFNENKLLRQAAGTSGITDS